MKCPHCSASVSMFSKDLNRFGKSNQRCPACGGPVQVSLKHVRMATVFIAVAVLGSALGLSIPVACGVAGGIAAAFAIGLKSSEA